MSDLSDIDRSARFVSGPWTGYFLQSLPGRHPTDAYLTFLDGQLTGNGSDRVGRFTVDGWYDPETGDCEWKKQYIGKHAVRYRGKHDEDGIWGVWEINMLFGLLRGRGGFHIWPEGMSSPQGSDRVEHALRQTMHKAGSPSSIGNYGYLALVILKIFLLTGLLAKLLS